MGKFVRIKNSDITDSLKETTRQYFAGNLSRPQILDYIDTDEVEIGVSNYPNHTYEESHKHSVAMEYQYMVSGWTEYMDIETGEIWEFKQGDFYAIFPGTSYGQRVKAGTRIIFIKVPSIDDKEIVNITASQSEWLHTKMKTIRKDYFHSKEAPEPNSIKPAAAVAILNEKQEILLLHRVDNNKWTMPGGTLEYGESLPECALREVQEECGLKVNLKDIIGIYSDPGIRIEYSDGEVRQEFTVLYYGEFENGEIIIDEESSGYTWVSFDRLRELPLADSQKRRLIAVENYVRKGVKLL